MSDMSGLDARYPGRAEKIRKSAPDLLKIYQKNRNDQQTLPHGNADALLTAHLKVIDQVYAADETKREAATKAMKQHFGSNYSYSMNGDEANGEILDFEYTNLAAFPELVEELKKQTEESEKLIAQDKNDTRIMNPTVGFWMDLQEYYKTDPNWTSCENDMMYARGTISGISDTFGSVGAYLEFENFLNNMANPGVELLLGSVAPECQKEENRIKVSANLECIPYNVPDPALTWDKAGNVTNGAKVITNIRNRILWSVLDGEKPMPVSLSICSAAIKDATIEPTFNEKDKCEKHEGEGSHAVTVIGARPGKKAGDCEYLVQNSWGADCSQVGGRECKDGKFWMSEANLFLNIDKISKIVDKTPK